MFHYAPRLLKQFGIIGPSVFEKILDIFCFCPVLMGRNRSKRKNTIKWKHYHLRGAKFWNFKHISEILGPMNEISRNFFHRRGRYSIVDGHFIDGGFFFRKQLRGPKKKILDGGFPLAQHDLTRDDNETTFCDHMDIYDPYCTFFFQTPLHKTWMIKAPSKQIMKWRWRCDWAVKGSEMLN